MHFPPMEQWEALWVHFRLIYRTVKRHGMLCDVVGDAEHATLNGVNLFEAYRCHRVVREILQHFAADLAFKDALKEPHIFVGVRNGGLQQLAANYNSSPARLKCLRGIASNLGVALTKFGKLETCRWAAFAFGALHSMRRGYVVVVCALHAMKPRDAEGNLKQQE